MNSRPITVSEMHKAVTALALAVNQLTGAVILLNDNAGNPANADVTKSIEAIRGVIEQLKGWQSEGL